MSTASSSFFSTNWSKSHNSFLGPKRPFLPFMPCFKICSRTIKKCCNGMWSESSWCPNLRLESRTSFMTSLRMLTKLLFSIWIGSRSEKRKSLENRQENPWVSVKIYSLAAKLLMHLSLHLAYMSSNFVQTKTLRKRGVLF